MCLLRCYPGQHEHEDEDEEEESQIQKWDTESLGLGTLDVASIQHLLHLARCLIRSKPEEATLDLPAQRLLASLQVHLQACREVGCSHSRREVLFCSEVFIGMCYGADTGMLYV